MEYERHKNDLRVQVRANRTLGAIAVFQGLAIFVLGFVVAAQLGTERTIVVPPSIERTFWVTKDKASREYLEQMAAYVAWLVLDVTPSTVDWKRNQLLEYVAPDDYAALKTQMDLEADRLRTNNAATSFLVQQLTADEKDQSVILAGRLRKQINGTDISEPATRFYRAQFKYAGGRVHVKSFKEYSSELFGQAHVGNTESAAAAR